MDVARVRGLYPTLAASTAHLDGSYAALQPESVIRAIIATLRAAPTQPGSRSSRSQDSATRLLRARRATADLVGGRAEDVVLGASSVSLLHRFATVISTDWQLGDEIVLNRLDTDASTHTWRRAAQSSGAVVRWAEVDVETGEVPAWQYDDLVGRRTRIVTVALGNPVTGMVPDVRAIADAAHARGALVVVDAGVTPIHLPLDIAGFGADVVLVSAPSFGGPNVGALVTRPGLFAEISDYAGGTATELFEAGPLPVELMDGFSAAVDHVADLDEHARGSRRDRLGTAVTAASRHTLELYRRLDEGLRALPGVTVLGAAERRLPVAAFTVAGRRPDEIGAFLQRRDVSVWSGPSGVLDLLSVFGADELGGAVFTAVMPHTAAAEIDHLLDAVRALNR